MDAFAVAIGKGMQFRTKQSQTAFFLALSFGFFQALMPCIGYFLGFHFQKWITSIDHWIAFFLLCFIGLHMLKERFQKSDPIAQPELEHTLSYSEIILLSIATSIDAFAIGISFAILNVPIFSACALIGTITFCFSFLGAIGASRIGQKYGVKATRIGGLVLIFMGIKILLEHLFS